MRRALVALCLGIGLMSLWAAPARAGFDSAAFRRNFVSGLDSRAGGAALAPENVEVQAVAKAADFAGTAIYAVRGRLVPAKGQARPFLLFVSADGRYFLPDLVDLRAGKSLLQAARDRVRSGDVKNYGHVVLKGRGKTPVLVVSDPFCPFCRESFAYMMKHMAAVSELRLAYFPLSSHVGSGIACSLMEWARRNDAKRYAAFVRFAFTDLRPPRLTDRGAGALRKARAEVAGEFLKRFPELSALGRDGNAIVAALTNSRETKDVQADVARAADLDLHGTPVFFVKGTRVDGFDEPRLEALLEK